MSLTDEQKQQVITWVQAGEGLAEIQRRIESDFESQMTYMEVRFLVDDLEIELVDKETKKANITDDPTKAVDADASLVDEGPGGSVKVEVDSVMRPGSMVSGSVTFTDGKSMGWQVDQMGRLGLIPGSGTSEDYRPPEADLMEFQEALEAELRKKGM